MQKRIFYHVKVDNLVQSPKSRLCEGSLAVIASRRRSNLVIIARDKLRNLAVCICLIIRDCRVAPLLAMTAVRTSYDFIKVRTGMINADKSRGSKLFYRITGLTGLLGRRFSSRPYHWPASRSTPPVMAVSGRMRSTAPSSMAFFGMPKTTQDSSSCAMV
jgi:hypothetical protein